MEPETFKHAVSVSLFLFVSVVVFVCECVYVGNKSDIKIRVPWPVRCRRTSFHIPK